MTQDAYKPLKAVIKGKTPDQKEIYLLRPLIKHSFLEEDENEQISCFSPAFSCFLKKNLTPGLLKGHEQYG